MHLDTDELNRLGEKLGKKSADDILLDILRSQHDKQFEEKKLKTYARDERNVQLAVMFSSGFNFD